MRAIDLFSGCGGKYCIGWKYTGCEPEKVGKNTHLPHPENMREIDLYNREDIQDLFTYCWESKESRQAWENSNSEFADYHEDLRIVWIKKELNLGYAFGLKNGVVKVYKIGSKDEWSKFDRNFADAFRGDNS